MNKRIRKKKEKQFLMKHFYDFDLKYFKSGRNLKQFVSNIWNMYNRTGLSINSYMFGNFMLEVLVRNKTFSHERGYNSITINPPKNGKYLVEFYNSKMPRYDRTKKVLREFCNGKWINPVYNYEGDGYELIGWLEAF